MSDTLALSERVIVRGSAGIFFGEITHRSDDGTRATLTNARRLWYWLGAASLSELATSGVKRPDKCKFPAPVTVEVLGIIEVLSVTKIAALSIDSVPVWAYQ